MSLYAKRALAIDTENAFKVGPHIAKVEAAGNPVVKLNLGEPDFGIPACVKEEIKRQIDRDNTHYCDPQGIIGLREAIAEDVGTMRGIEISPAQVVVFPGAKPGIGFTQEIYCEPGDEIIYPSPGFPIFESFIRYVGGVPVPLHLREENKFSFTAEELEELITDRTKLIFLNFPSNPTGGVATQEQLEGIARVIQERCGPDVRIYSDEIYERILFDGSQHRSIASIPGMQERTIISSGFSKSFAWTGGRIGYVVAPSVEEAEMYKNLNINYFSCVAPYNQEGAREALQNPASLEAVAKMVKTFEERRDVVWKALNEIEGVRCLKPEGAFYLFPNIEGVCEKLGATEADGATRFQMFALYHHHVAVMDRRSFGKIGSEGQQYLRLSVAADLDTLMEGVRRLKLASEDVKGYAEYAGQVAV